MSDKVKLPREVAEAITFIRNSNMADHGLYDRKWLESQVDSTPEIDAAKVAILKYITRTDDRWDDDNQLITYYRALLNGFEIIQTPEDKVREYCKQLREDHDIWSNGQKSNTSPYGYELTGCIRALNLLGIKIEGVNA